MYRMQNSLMLQYLSISEFAQDVLLPSSNATGGSIAALSRKAQRRSLLCLTYEHHCFFSIFITHAYDTRGVDILVTCIHSLSVCLSVCLYACLCYYYYYYYCFPALWILSGITRVSQYQKKHSSTHTFLYMTCCRLWQILLKSRLSHSANWSPKSGRFGGQ